MTLTSFLDGCRESIAGTPASFLSSEMCIFLKHSWMRSLKSFMYSSSSPSTSGSSACWDNGSAPTSWQMCRDLPSLLGWELTCCRDTIQYVGETEAMDLRKKKFRILFTSSLSLSSPLVGAPCGNPLRTHYVKSIPFNTHPMPSNPQRCSFRQTWAPATIETDPWFCVTSLWMPSCRVQSRFCFTTCSTWHVRGMVDHSFELYWCVFFFGWRQVDCSEVKNLDFFVYRSSRDSIGDLKECDVFPRFHSQLRS